MLELSPAASQVRMPFARPLLPLLLLSLPLLLLPRASVACRANITTTEALARSVLFLFPGAGWLLLYHLCARTVTPCLNRPSEGGANSEKECADWASRTKSTAANPFTALEREPPYSYRLIGDLCNMSRSVLVQTGL